MHIIILFKDKLSTKEKLDNYIKEKYPEPTPLTEKEEDELFSGFGNGALF